MEPSSRTYKVLWAAQGLALVVLAAHAAHTGLGLWDPALRDVFENWVYNGLMLGGALACLARGALLADDRGAWLVLGVGALAWSAGDIWYSLFLADDANPPLP